MPTREPARSAVDAERRWSGAARRAALSRADLVVLGTLLATAAFLSWKVTCLSGIVGAYIDDGVYLATAKALADGQGYRHTELPGEPYQTKYPILYPLLLSALWRIAPSFPQNMGPLRIVNVFLWTLGLWLLYRMMRRGWGLAAWLPACGVLLAFTTLNTVELLRTAMSEPLYLALSAAALLLALPATERGAPVRSSGTARPAVCTLLAAAVCLTRVIGISLVVALVTDLALRRQWKALVLTAIGPALALMGWLAWCTHAGRLTGADAALAGFRYDLDYGAWLSKAPGTLLWVAWLNASDLALSLTELLTPLWTGEELTRRLAGGFGGAWTIYLAMLVGTGLLVCGLIRTWRRGWLVSHAYLAAYFAMVLVWPFPPVRFVLPVLPLVLTLQLLGAYTLASLAGRILLRIPRPAGLATAAVVLIVLGAGFQRMQPLLGPDWRIDSRELAESGREALVTLLRDHTPPDAIVSADYGAYLYLRTGRKVVASVPHDNPIAIMYTPDRCFRDCGRVITRNMADRDLEHTRGHLVDYLRASQAGFVVPPDRRCRAYWAVFGRLSRGGTATLVAKAEPYELYRLSLPPP